ncbi:MAG: HEAT repeat domain-containing protein, partial [Nostoc sp.]
MPKHLHQMKKRSPFFLFPFILLLTLLVALPWVSAKERPKPKPEAWQINGIVAAIDDENDGVKGSAFNKLVEYDLKDLKSLGKKAEDIAQKAAKILKDKTVDPNVRSGAASALGNLGEAAKPYVKDIADILKDKTV